ncbi:MAG: tryptophan synthase subunit alpha [Candidatus Promineifilaceae bacterium]|nr:tryptophan synthase subunit alpha [Candidatus Promineifilaceae bacterium]
MQEANSTGKNEIAAAFKQALSTQTAALMPYFTLGYPDRDRSLEIIEAIAPYSDLLELGVPFSDPLADGPTIQNSTQISLENGTTVASCLDMVRELRRRGVKSPICLMGYYNPMLAYGLDRFVFESKDAGVQGFIVPDLPPEEAAELLELVNDAGLAYIFLLAPTSNTSRIKQVSAAAQGFIYLVSVTGVTGARSALQSDLAAFVGRVRENSEIPLAIGFGISTPNQAASVAGLADGVIVGSALINAVNVAENKPAAAAQFVKSLQSALSI